MTSKLLDIVLRCLVLVSLSSCSSSPYSQTNPRGSRNTYFQGSLIGAVCGGTIGSVIGLAYANHVVKTREDYRNASDYIVACTDRARGLRLAAEETNSRIARQISAERGMARSNRARMAHLLRVRAELRSEIARQEEATQLAEREAADPLKIEVQQQEIRSLNQEAIRTEELIRFINSNVSFQGHQIPDAGFRS